MGYTTLEQDLLKCFTKRDIKVDNLKVSSRKEGATHHVYYLIKTTRKKEIT